MLEFVKFDFFFFVEKIVKFDLEIYILYNERKNYEFDLVNVRMPRGQFLSSLLLGNQVSAEAEGACIGTLLFVGKSINYGRFVAFSSKEPESN